MHPYNCDVILVKVNNASSIAIVLDKTKFYDYKTIGFFSLLGSILSLKLEYFHYEIQIL